MKNALVTLETYTRFCAGDFGPWQETFTLQQDKTGLVLVASAGYSKPFDSHAYRLHQRPKPLAECFEGVEDLFVDTTRDQSADLSYQLGVDVEELEPDRDTLHPEGL